MNRFYNRCNRIYVPTEIISAEITALGIKKELIKIWPRGIRGESFYPGAHKGYDFANVISKEKPNILFASRLVWEKNLKILIEINKLSCMMGNPYHFIIAGDGIAAEELKKEIPEAVFTGQLDREHLAALYANCDIFLFTSVTETFGNVVAEAMASGLPCVIADGGGSSALIKNGVTGFKCNPDDPSEFITKIDVILNEPELRRQFILKGLEYSATLSWDSLTFEYFNELNKLTGNTALKNRNYNRIQNQIQILQ